MSPSLAEGEHVYMKAPPAYDIGEGSYLSMNKCIYGLVQGPRHYYLLCREVYGRSGLKRFHTDECVFVRYVSNMKGQSLLTNQGFLINGRLFKMDFVPDKMRVNKLCCHPVAAMILVMYVDYNGIQHNCEELVKGFEKVVKIEGAWLCARSRLSSTTDRHLVLSPDGLGSQGKGCFVFPKKRNSLDFVGKL